ncbi:unnamed protein product [Clonostachys solani]|uniref:Uncharacterized protein n=1 Tax=Clonostachys solani TaxID=160281 RepID=A0A9N9YXQ6_9HYPO|nr:unnamed protein product [Clonostachys solani]
MASEFAVDRQTSNEYWSLALPRIEFDAGLLGLHLADKSANHLQGPFVRGLCRNGIVDGICDRTIARAMSHHDLKGLNSSVCGGDKERIAILVVQICERIKENVQGRNGPVSFAHNANRLSASISNLLSLSLLGHDQEE